MNPTGDEIRGAISLAKDSGLLEVPERIRTLATRIDGHATAVALIGMQNRGKSTLFNRLVGAEVSAVAATPETASTIRVTNGPPSATGRTRSGQIVELPTDPSAFMDRLRRGGKDPIIAAQISGKFRLPDGLMLVDTPGVGDVATLLDENLAELDEQWIEAGAGAAVVVFCSNVFPDSSDRALLEKAQQAFPGAVEVVVKPTSRDFDDSEMPEIVESIENTFGISVLPLKDVTPIERWGENESFGSIERLLTDLEQRAAVRIDGDIERYEAFIDAFIEELQTAQLIDLPKLRSLPATQPLPQRLRREFNGAIDRLTKIEESESAAAARETERIRAAEADRRAVSIIGLYRITTGGWGERLALIADLSACAAEGSREATKFLESLLVTSTSWPESNWSERRKYFETVSAALPDVPTEALIMKLPLSFDELLKVLKSKTDDRLRDSLEKLAMRKVGRDSAAIAALKVVVSDAERKRSLENSEHEARVEEQTQKVRKAISDIPTIRTNGSFESIAQLTRAARTNVDRSLTEATEIPAATRAELRSTADKTIAEAWERAAELAIVALRTWYETYPLDEQEADRKLKRLLDESKGVAEATGNTAVGRRLNSARNAAQATGRSWVLSVRAAEAEGKQIVARRRNLLSNLFGLSIVAMPFAAILAAVHPTIALLGVGAFVMALISSEQSRAVTHWQDVAPRVEFPSAVSALGSDGPRRTVLPDREQVPQGGRGCAIAAVAVFSVFVALAASISYSNRKENSSLGSSSYSGLSSTLSDQTTRSTRSSSSTSVTSTTSPSTTRSSTTSTTRAPTTSSTRATTTTINTSTPTELLSGFSYEPLKCISAPAQPQPYPHSSTATYEVTATIGLWTSSTTSSTLIGTIPVSSYGPGGIGCPDGSGPYVKVICKRTGQTISGPFGSDPIWLKVTIGGNTGFVTDQWVDTRWDVGSLPAC